MPVEQLKSSQCSSIKKSFDYLVFKKIFHYCVFKKIFDYHVFKKSFDCRVFAVPIITLIRSDHMATRRVFPLAVILNEQLKKWLSDKMLAH